MIAKLSTSWIGTYRYDVSDQRPNPDFTVKFEMSLSLGWLGRFSGRIVEDDQGVPEPAEIRGWISRTTIAFRKTYSNLWIVDRQGVTTAVTCQPTLVLYYRGKIVDDRTRMVGDWKSLPDMRRVGDEEWELPEASGTWDATALGT
jgi:hypothetical protein